MQAASQNQIRILICSWATAIWSWGNEESIEEVKARLECLESSPVIQAVADQDLNPHFNDIGGGGR